jgi:hypothetical protein
MLSLLAAQLLNVPRHISEQDDEEAIVNVGLFTICTDVGRPQSVDVDALKALVPPLPNVRWRAVAGMCGQAISPMYKSIQNMLHEDSEHVARLFSELEPLFSDDDNEVSHRTFFTIIVILTRI